MSLYQYSQQAATASKYHALLVRLLVQLQAIVAVCLTGAHIHRQAYALLHGLAALFCIQICEYLTSLSRTTSSSL